jgi:predicted permease
MPVMFMNSAYLAIPVNTLLWGPAGTAYAIVYNMAVTVSHFTVGIYLVARREPLAEMFRVPIIYAVAAGMALNAFHVYPPASVSVLLTVMSRATLAVMLMFVGYRLCLANSSCMKDAAIGVGLRMGGGVLIAALLVKLAGLSGPVAGVCIMSSAMPTAVNSYLLAEQYDCDPSFAASTVFLGTVLSLAAIPLIAYIIT